MYHVNFIESLNLHFRVGCSCSVLFPELMHVLHFCVVNPRVGSEADVSVRTARPFCKCWSFSLTIYGAGARSFLRDNCDHHDNNIFVYQHDDD